jgi:ABC-2 type transport system ATP-binding protein
VMDRGSVRFDGAVVDLVRTAEGRVWLCDEPGADAVASWRTGTGRHRVVGGPRPAGADATEPTLEDAYLLMLGPGATAPLPTNP